MKYIIQPESLSLILSILSNHPKRRTFLGDRYYTAQRDRRISENGSQAAQHTSCLHLVVGDSHGEFFTRKLFKDSFPSRPRNTSACFHTGATTMLGAMNSRTYLSDLAISTKIIVDRMSLQSEIDKLNLSLSLGEIDLRTKIYIEALRERDGIPTEERLILTSDSYRNKLAFTISWLQEILHSALGTRMGKVSIVMPPPPSLSFPYQLPKTISEASYLIHTVKYPRFGAGAIRCALWRSFCELLSEVCNAQGAYFLAHKLYIHHQSLSPEWSDDGCHVNKGLASHLGSYIAHMLN